MVGVGGAQRVCVGSMSFFLSRWESCHIGPLRWAGIYRKKSRMEQTKASGTLEQAGLESDPWL